MAKSSKAIFLAAMCILFCTLGRTSAFSLGNLNRHNKLSTEHILQTQSSFSISSDKEQVPISETSVVALNESKSGLKQSLLAGCITFLTTTPFASFADDLEVAELPPPYIPVIFGILVIGGVGVLTASLGDVYTEESNLGLQSGARAKKERERSRSSYFKK